ncbi:unnamed protein product [Calypogeia fissa]
MCDATVKFSVLCDLFDGVVRAKKGKKGKHVGTFLDAVYTDHEYFSALRLMLPVHDRLRDNYGLKEATLGKFIGKALDIPPESQDAQKLVNWRKGGTRAGSNAGNFANIATEVLSKRQRVTSTGLTIKDVNDLLDRLAAEKGEGKAAVLAELINKTSAKEMKWIVMIILKDLKLGISEKTILSVFHPDAEHVFNVTSDLQRVCETLQNRNERYSRHDIQVGTSVRPQLAVRVDSVEEAWKKFRGKQVVVECKFDGERVQIHKDGNSLNFYSRKAIDNQAFKYGIADVLIQNVVPEKCILDGEMLAWDRSRNCFKDFGTLREVAKAAQDGLETSVQLCYVAFDILYSGSSIVIDLPLRQRQDLLRKAVRPVKRRLELVIPNLGLGTQQRIGGSEWSAVAKSADDIEHFFQRCVENKEEGIIIKDLDSKWEPGDRSGKWLKLKPDYVLGRSDIDVLIIGGYFGTGRRGGQVAQFLLGVAEKPKAGETPTVFHSFCKVGNGLSDTQSDDLVHRLSPYLRRNEKNSKPPNCYKVTNNAKERPDVWVDRPEKSIILELNSDIRFIETDVFATRYALRFPRVHKVRLEKPWYDCLDIQTLLDMVNSERGSAVGANGHQKIGGRPNKNENRGRKRARSSFLPLVPSHMRNTDVSQVKHATEIFEKHVFYFVNSPVEHSQESFHKRVVENGGAYSMNLNNAMTHAIASERKGLKYQAAIAHGDVIHFSWVIDCCTAKTLLPVTPKYFLHLSDQTKENRKDEIDDYGDNFFLDIDVADLKQIFKNIDTATLSIDQDKLARAKKKYCSSSAFCQFSDCHFYFHKPIHSSNPDSRMVAEIALKRQELEVSMHGGDVSECLDANVTHMIVYTSSKQALPFRTIVKSVSKKERKLLTSDKLKILSHQWIDDHMLGTCGHPMKDSYDLRDPSFQFNEDTVDEMQMAMEGKAREGLADSVETLPDSL